MTLEQSLEALREKSRGYVPDHARQIMGRAVEDLRASGLLDRIPKPGQPAPSFQLENTRGDSVSSTQVLAGSPLVLTFYRGFW